MKGGEFDEGMDTIRAGLSLALEHELTLEAAEVYQRLGTAHEIAGDYGGARARSPPRSASVRRAAPRARSTRA